MSIRRSIVYFGYLGDEGTADEMVVQRLGFMDSQLRWLSDLVAMAATPIDGLVAYVAPRRWDAPVHHAITRLGFRVDPESVLADRRNTFEYPGFRAMKALALASGRDDLIFYCHSKGIVELSPAKMGLFRLHTTVCLTAGLDALRTDPRLTRAGLFPARRGWCWFNFFWIKAGYMATLPVGESADRYGFEALIGGGGGPDGYLGVLPLIDRLPFADTGIPVRRWYRPEETTAPALQATHARYAAMASPEEAVPG